MSQVLTSECLPTEWRDLYENLPPLCTRYQIAQQSNLVAVGTIANRDSQKRGIPGKKQAGKKIVYPRLEAVKWLMAFVAEGKAGAA